MDQGFDEFPGPASTGPDARIGGAPRYMAGPWFVTTDPKNDYWHAGSTIGTSSGGRRVADVDLFLNEETRWATARLIAAAPDLLEALDWLLASIEATDADRAGRLELAKAAARTTIAQAIGSDGSPLATTLGNSGTAP